ncbi:hypothetical protein FB565_000089 [Actinoplanes lutulentus]|uniref:hypothetical protein n=1 Tax=Actinoplanes lutulentus TaxID=1287878 RepID=UPI0011B93DFF|nr:hypothetical protein [Actinoplanes lutulentus]MBB2940385.1 hypothetical protein [Actinoplanes lutulentus]
MASPLTTLVPSAGEGPAQRYEHEQGPGGCQRVPEGLADERAQQAVSNLEGPDVSVRGEAGNQEGPARQTDHGG